MTLARCQYIEGLLYDYVVWDGVAGTAFRLAWKSGSFLHPWEKSVPTRCGANRGSRASAGCTGGRAVLINDNGLNSFVPLGVLSQALSQALSTPFQKRHRVLILNNNTITITGPLCIVVRVGYQLRVAERRAPRQNSILLGAIKRRGHLGGHTPFASGHLYNHLVHTRISLVQDFKQKPAM